MRRDESALMEVFSKSQIELNRAECRKYYDKRIEDCNGQITKSYACSIDEYSGDDSQLGGFFSHSLIKTAKNRLKQASVDTSKKYRILPIDSIHDGALSEVVRLSENKQHPQIRKPRTDIQLPFGIIA